MSQTDTESAVDVKLPFPSIRRELPKRHPETMEEIQQNIDKPVPTATLTKVSIVIPVYNEEATVQTWFRWWSTPRCPRPAPRDHLRQRLLQGRDSRQAR